MAAGAVTADGRVRVLADGNEMPMLGLGVWQVPNGPECVNAVRWALELGYRHIDTAQAYGNEESVGQGLRESGVPREEVFITTKFYPGAQGPGRRGRAEPAAARRRPASTSTSSTGRRAAPHGPGRAWSGLASSATRARSACRTSTSSELEQVMGAASIAPVVDQVQFSPFVYRRALLEACQERGIALEAYSPLGTGRHLGDATVGRVAQRVGRTPAQVLLRWCIQRDIVVIPKSTHRERIEENSQVFDFVLSDEDMAELDGLDETGGTGKALERKWW